MEIRKAHAATMRARAQSLREAACGFSSGVSRTLLDLADAMDAQAALLEAKAAGDDGPARVGGTDGR